MYKVKHNKDLNILVVEDSNQFLYGKIFIKDGASLQELTLEGIPIIQDLSPLEYKKVFSSSILFPFANRIKDGTYSFNGENYQFEINHEKENNALHGLIFDKTFQIIDTKTNQDSATIILEYDEKKKSVGFPFTYNIQLRYTFSKNQVQLKILVKNTDLKAFPYTIGWHPYFISDNLYESNIEMDSSKKLIIGERNITTGIDENTQTKTIEIKDKQLDDCWVLDSNKIKFNTPKYQLIIDLSSKNNFLQVFTPPKKNAIAIEPTTGVSDSFNNKIGLEILKPDESYDLTWSLQIITN